MRDFESDRIWSLLPGDEVRPQMTWDGVAFTGAAFAVQQLADISVGLAVSAGTELATDDVTQDIPSSSLQHQQTLAAFSGHLRVDGVTPSKWADLSGVYRTADERFIQLHCNFPHHAAGVIEHLGTSADRTEVAAAIGRRSALELESELIDRGMIAAACRTLDEWRRHPHAAATHDLPLVSVEQIGQAPPRPPAASADHRPARGVRVIDCSRVLAGPVCGQTLAGAGADVLRIGAAHLPSMDMAVVGTGFGKRSTHLDFRRRSDRAAALGLIGDGHVVIDAYRPGALAAQGLSPERLAELAPGVVVLQLSAFDWVGPWAHRRGFDSIVQSTTGITMAGATACDSQRPVPLPVQALDYATGYLSAFAIMRMLVHQRRNGGSWLLRISLLRTRNWLASLGGPDRFVPTPLPDLAPWMHSVESEFGRLEAPAPILGQWDRPPTPLGSSPARWLSD